MKPLRSNGKRPSTEMPAPDRSIKSATISTWKTDRKLRIVGVSTRSARLKSALPAPGEVISPRGRQDGFLRYRAHAEALRGKRTAYRITLFLYSYEVVVTPRRDRRRRIIGVQGRLKLDLACGEGLSGGWEGTLPGLRERKQKGSLRKKTSMASALRSLELARAVSDTVRVSAEVRNSRLVATTERALEAKQKAEAGERRARLLADANAILDSSLDPRGIFDPLARLVVARMADWFVIEVRDHQHLRRTGLACNDLQRTEILERMFPINTAHEEPGLIGDISLTSNELIVDVTLKDLAAFIPAGPCLDAAKELKTRSLIRTPMVSHGRRIGYLTLGAEEPNPPFNLQDLRTVRELASRIAMTRENLLLYQEAQKEIAMRKEIESRMRVLNAELERRVSDRTRLLEEATREANSFAYTVAHDLRAPLRAITGFCQALREDYVSAVDSQGQDYLDRIVTGARKMDDLIRDLLDYARINRADLQRTLVDLDVVVGEVLHLMAPELQERKAEIQVAKPLGRVIAHGPVLVQVFTNLISNATKFVAPGVQPVVRIRGESGKNRVRILIEDNGIGISPEHHERIFGIFERLNRAEEYPGTGIGLAIVRRSLERLEGSVGVESQPGLGSTFRVDLPSA